jgi:hypothetical protein
LRAFRLVERLRQLRPLLVLPFVSQFVLLGVSAGGIPSRGALAGATLGALGSLALWTSVWNLRGYRAARTLAATVSGLLLTIDVWILRYYGTTLDRQVVVSALHSWADVRPVVYRILPWELLAAVVVCGVEYACLSAGSTRDGPKLGLGKTATLMGIATAFMVLAPSEGKTPDARALGAITLAGGSDAKAATRGDVPLLPSTRSELPNVLLILTESVRDETYCDAPGPDCPFTPELDKVLPDRVPLRQMRSMASYTAIAAAALLTGRPPAEARTDVLAAPTLFDYARAVRVGDRRPTVAYWSAQAAGVLERDVGRSIDSWITVETLLGHDVADEDDVVELGMDEKLRERFVRDLPGLPRPFVLVLHFLGTHAPYFVDDARAPFRPYGHVAAWSSLDELRSAYQDAVVAQDREVAACVRSFLELQGSAPWMILFTSDHGEAFGEHGAIHHGQNLYDEQIHVPGWIAFGGGALDAEQQRLLVTRQSDYVTHLDVVPTLLDVLGVWRGLAMTGARSRLPGRSLLGPALAEPAVLPITNCTGLFPCPLNTWGLLSGSHVLEAQPWDADWNCVDLATGREHARDAGCGRLREASKAYFPTLPNGRTNSASP